jgi:hypothetical protein
MKLFFCPKCHDIIKLTFSLRYCVCGECHGMYEKDGLHARISANAVPLGFANSSFVEALKKRPKDGWGQRFEAFVIPEKCDTVEVIKSHVSE